MMGFHDWIIARILPAEEQERGSDNKNAAIVQKNAEFF